MPASFRLILVAVVLASERTQIDLTINDGEQKPTDCNHQLVVERSNVGFGLFCTSNEDENVERNGKIDSIIHHCRLDRGGAFQLEP